MVIYTALCPPVPLVCIPFHTTAYHVVPSGGESDPGHKCYRHPLAATVPAAAATSTRDSCGSEGRLGELLRSPPQPQGYLQVKPRPRCHGMCGRVARTKVELKKAMMRSRCPPHTGAAFVHARLWENQGSNTGKPELENQRGRT